jgi:double-stranded uracil-DNA glycosylase
MSVLPDVLAPGLRVVFCGTRAGRASAERGVYYAGRGNKFWPVLAQIGLTPREYHPSEFRSLLAIGIGLTDIAKRSFGPDSAIRYGDWDVGGFWARISAVNPTVVAFNGKKAAAIALGTSTGALDFGILARTENKPTLAILPSTSGMASRYWRLEPWTELATNCKKR